ncbi:NAD(P)/FAD-dependent oxidoreductase [Actinoplanes sp. NPDC049548]|uniref:FAD-dependent oxidoreductase n=1 Tax=Actinoplanes sp. NPDC049548 TaxID=3155152 RepID=UPI00343BE893
MRVLIAGAGIGGLCLAQGLHRAGIDVHVFERCPSPEAFPAGYRIHIDPDGSRALHSCLPPARFAEFVAACGPPPRTFAFLDHRLRELLTVDVVAPGQKPDPIGQHRAVNRYRLRQTLLEGLAGRVQFGAELVRYDQNGEVTAHFADGTRATGDLLVGAEGTHSPTRAQLLPHAERADTGVDCIAGRLALDTEVRALLPAQLLDGPGLILAPGGRNVFAAVHDDMLVWGLSVRRSAGPRGGSLRTDALELSEGWHPDLRHIMELTRDFSSFTIRTARPVRDWPASRVTVLGDAIHSMPPSRGIGANTALRDAELLCRNLVSGMEPVAAVADYERQMRRYGFAAVKASVAAQKQGVIVNPLAFAASKAALRFFQAVPPVRRLVFG